MKYFKIILLLVIFGFFFYENIYAQKNIEGRYKTSGYYAGSSLIINSNKTFSYKYWGHITSDTAAGIFVLSGDTIFLKYTFNDYDYLSTSDISQNIELQLAANRASIHRPKTLIVKRKKLYFIAEKNEKVYMNRY